MPYAITQNCCNDASCVAVCPVNCIHPTPSEPDFGSTEMLYVDARSCIDCGACSDACPVDAIHPVDTLRGPAERFVAVNAGFYTGRPAAPLPDLPDFPMSLPPGVRQLRVAVVGTGPAAWYTADLLLRGVGARVTMIERLPSHGGLVRFGVAPDHPATRRIGDGFATLIGHPRLQMMMNVEVGRDVSAQELAAHHDAVVYAVGAPDGRSLGIPGEQLPGSFTAADLVGWYNAHPDARDTPVELGAGQAGQRVVIVGNGNVALDIARILTGDPDTLAHTDISPDALTALRSGTVREVVVMGRRGPDEASYTGSELEALKHLPGVRLVVEDQPAVRAAIAGAGAQAPAALLRDVELAEIDWTSSPPAGRRIVLQFWTRPVALDGPDRVRAVAAVRTVPGLDEAGAGAGAGDHDVSMVAGAVVRALGYRGRPLAGVPFDPATSTVPNLHGRVLDAPGGTPVPGAFVVGWIKRGSSGGIGANRRDAEETVAALVEDAGAGRLPAPAGTQRQFARLVRRRGRRTSTRAR